MNDGLTVGTTNVPTVENSFEFSIITNSFN